MEDESMVDVTQAEYDRLLKSKLNIETALAQRDEFLAWAGETKGAEDQGAALKACSTQELYDWLKKTVAYQQYDMCRSIVDELAKRVLGREADIRRDRETANRPRGRA